MSATVIAVIIIAAFLASFIQRVTGFGYGIVFMTVAPYLMPSYGEATALSGMLAIVCALVTGVQMFRHVPWRKLIVILLTFLVVSFFAVKAVARLDNRLLKHFLGGILILVSLYFFFVNGKFRMKTSVFTQVGMGAVSGAMGGLFGMQGPPAVVYFISCSDRKEEYMGLTQWYFIIGNIAMTVYRAGNGFLTHTVENAWLVGVPAVLLGLLIGAKVYKRLPIEAIRKVVYFFIFIAGVVAFRA